MHDEKRKKVKLQLNMINSTQLAKINTTTTMSEYKAEKLPHHQQTVNAALEPYQCILNITV